MGVGHRFTVGGTTSFCYRIGGSGREAETGLEHRIKAGRSARGHSGDTAHVSRLPTHPRSSLSSSTWLRPTATRTDARVGRPYRGPSGASSWRHSAFRPNRAVSVPGNDTGNASSLASAWEHGQEVRPKERHRPTSWPPREVGRADMHSQHAPRKAEAPTVIYLHPVCGLRRPARP